jgi:DNA-binding NarL/FixJ family response regulator
MLLPQTSSSVGAINPQPKERIRVVTADDHPSVRENLRYLLSAEADFEVVGIANDGASALLLVEKLRPDVLVVDYQLPDQDGLSVARVLRRERVRTRIILYTTNREVCGWATRSGVDVCVSKDDPPAALINSIRVLGRMRPRKPARVLVVEDDAEVRQLMRVALENDEHEIIEAGDGLDALAQCQRRAPGVVVLDLGLPEMSGQEFVAAYRRMSSRHAPIVVVSAIPGARRIAMDLGAAAFVSKPFSVEDLVEIVRRVSTPQPRPHTALS